ncbi:hypothetical protein ACQ858_22250 [Variovorax ureilyticus]|uniref:hypothetical protein n=1 Tax=Variovorax ureilyticus TaxID=1836198 RepID=UPI003D6721A1
MSNPIIRTSVTAAAIIATLALMACTPKYVQPMNGTALVRLHVTDSGLFAMLHTYEKEGCEGPRAIGLIGGAAFVNAEGDLQRVIPTMLGSSGAPTPETIELRAHSDKPFTVLYSQMGPHSALVARRCNLPVRFTPAANAQYQIDYSYEGERCYAKVSRLVSVGDSIQKVTVADALKEKAACSPYIY